MLRLHRSQQEAQRRTLRACTEQQHLFDTRIYEILPRQQFVHFTGSSLSSTTVHSTFTEPRTFPPPSSHHQARLHFSADMALFGFDQDPGQVESFFFFDEGKQVECFTENEHHPQVKSLSPGPARSEWHGFPPPGIHDTANGWPGTKWKAATTAAERSPPRHPRAADHVLHQQAVAALLHPTSNGKEKRPPRRRHDSKRSDATCLIA